MWSVRGPGLPRAIARVCAVIVWVSVLWVGWCAVKAVEHEQRGMVRLRVLAAVSRDTVQLSQRVEDDLLSIFTLT